MDFETFKKGITILSVCVTDFDRVFNSEGSDVGIAQKFTIWYGFLKDLHGETYLEAVKRICDGGSGKTGIYPGTILTALIKENYRSVIREQRDEPEPLQLPDGLTEEQYEDGKKKLREIMKGIGGRSE